MSSEKKPRAEVGRWECRPAVLDHDPKRDPVYHVGTLQPQRILKKEAYPRMGLSHAAPEASKKGIWWKYHEWN